MKNKLIGFVLGVFALVMIAAVSNAPNGTIGGVVTTWPTNTVVGFMRLEVKFGGTNLFIPVCFTNR